MLISNDNIELPEGTEPPIKEYWIALNRETKLPINVCEGPPPVVWWEKYDFIPWSAVERTRDFVKRAFHHHADPVMREEARQILKAADDLEMEAKHAG